jgi:3',5'-cyclic AMP phosphodiesterase CpdA
LIRILHFSDPHVQLPRWRERKLRELGPLRSLATVELWKGRGRAYDDALEKLRQIVRDAEELRADFVACTGDLTQLAMEEEFALAREALLPLGERLVCIHGNHDRFPLAGRANKLYEVYFPPRPLPEPFVALDSCGDLCWPIVTRGRIDPGQLCRDFDRRVVLVHHAPVADWPWHELGGRRQLLAATRNAAAVLCGHKHQRRREGNVFCAGSSTERGKEGYWLLELRDGRVASATLRGLGGGVQRI